MKIKLIAPFLFVCLILCVKPSQAQLKIGFDARNLGAPKITLLDLKVDPAATYGKGFTYPVVTQTQREQMKVNNGGTIPDGMSVYNQTVKALQVYSADPTINDWITYSPAKSEMLIITPSNLNQLVNEDLSSYVLTNSRKLTPNGRANVVYNHITLQKGVDFTLDEATKTITFITLIPTQFSDFTQFELEYNF